MKQTTHKEDVLDLDGLMKQDAGRRFLAKLLRSTGYFDASFNMSQRVTDYNEGRRGVGLDLYRQMKEANPGQLINILKEIDDAT